MRIGLLEMGHLVLLGWHQGNVRKDCPRPWPQGGSWGADGAGSAEAFLLQNSSGSGASMHEGSLQTWQQHVEFFSTKPLGSDLLDLQQRFPEAAAAVT